MREPQSLPPPTLTAVIPAFNREATLGRALESVIGQERPPEEVLVVDDGSVDGTRRVAESFGPPVRCIPQRNAGASAARNRGVREAAHPWIAFLDSDDYWTPGHLARIVEAIRATGGRAGLYFDDTRRTPERGGRLLWDVAGFAARERWELSEDGTAWAALPVQPMMLQASVFRRSTFLELGGLREDLRCRHDTHLFFLACLGRPVCAVSGCGVVQTSEDASGGRVTEAFGSGRDSYWAETAILYADVLARGTTLSASQRRDLRARLASAHLRLARSAWGRGAVPRALLEVLRATRASPARTLQGVRRLAGSASARRQEA